MHELQLLPNPLSSHAGSGKQGLRRSLLVLSLVAALLAFFGTPTFAQTSKGILAGVVRDTTGAVVPGATVKATNTGTQDVRTTKTSGDGSYRLDALQPGNYTISASQAGFTTAVTENLAVNASIVTTHDVTFTVGSNTQEVTVQAENSGINTVNGQLAGVISTKELQDLPIFSLNPVELALTVPGVQPVSENSGFSNGLNIEVNGARPRANNFLLDGQEINDVGIGGQAFQPNIPDIFQSVTVITNTPSAEYGRAGGAVVNLVTKAGTNTFHGSVFERYTGSGLNSLDGVTRQAKISGTPPPGYVPPQKARFDQHQFGFTLGGPILRDKLFAFGALQISRYYGKEVPSRIELPDAAGFAQLQKIGGPQVDLLNQYLSNGDYLKSYVSFPGVGVVSNINVGVQNNCPTGCTVTTGYFQRQNADENSPDTQWMYRVDFTPRTQDAFSFRYLHDRASLSPDFFNNGAALVGFDTQQGGPTELGAGTWTHIFGSNVVNELRGSEARLGFLFAPTAATQANPLYALSTINISNLPSLGPNQNFPQGRHEDLYQVQDTVSITHGRQTLRVGADIGRTIETDIVSINAKGTLNFAKGGSGVSALGNFLQNQLGPSGSATKVFGSTRVDPHGWRSGAFAQDDVKLSPALTVNLGIRYDYLTNPENSLPYPGIDASNPFLPINTVVKVKNDTNNFAPRIGFAYSPQSEGFLGAGKTVVRGGFGVSYDSPFSNFVVNAAQSSPNAVGGNLTSTQGNGLANATTLIGSISPNLNPKSSVLSVLNNTVNPVTYQFNLGIERQLPGSNLLAVRYVGSIGKKLYANRQFNYFAPDGSGNRIDPTRGAINARGTFASSSYNAAQVEYTHNFQHGILINANYVFSKSLDNASEIFTTGSANTSYQANLGPGGLAQEWGPSTYDHRHFVSVTYVWAPAGFHSNSGFADAALGLLTRHWTISGIEQFQSGSYSNIDTAGFDTNGDGNAFNDRPLIGSLTGAVGTGGIDGANLDPGTGALPGVYYDIATAVNPANGQTVLNPVSPGSVRWLIPYQPENQFIRQEIGRNAYENPGSTTNNIAVEKGFGAKYLHLDRGNFILRGELQNIGNHNDVGILDVSVSDIGNPNYLNRSNARQGTNRNLVLWGKFTF